MSSSDSEVEKETDSEVSTSRLGDCEVCGVNKAIYSCPKCEVKTCSLTCVRIHKKELECDGIRDGTKFIRMKDFNETDLLRDYRMLEECSRFVYAVKRDEKKKFSRIDKDLPIHLYKLKMAARKRGIVLQFLAQNFTRHSINSTRYNFKSDIIHWRIEWVFPNAEPDAVKFVDEKCPENVRLSELLNKYLNSKAPPFEGSKALVYYKSIGFSGVKILLRAEKVKSSSKKFFELDAAETVAENLSGKCIVEFPLIFVVLKDHSYNFDIITPEDEFDYEQVKNKGEKSDENSNTGVCSTNNEKYVHPKKRQRTLLTEKIAIEKKKEIEKEIKEAKKRKPKNLLFTTGYSSAESLSDSCEDGEEIH